MSMQYCDYCHKMIDTDYNSEHFPHSVDTEGDFSGADYNEVEGR